MELLLPLDALTPTELIICLHSYIVNVPKCPLLPNLIKIH
ncbi:hypothetical protein SAMN05216404_1261, partial [Nitrosospira multiformis]